MEEIDANDVLELRRQLAEAKQQVAAEKQRADQLQEGQSASSLTGYLHLVKEKLFPALIIESDPHLVSSGSVTNIDGKYYPLVLEKWVEFEDIHTQLFEQVCENLGSKLLFSSKIEMNSTLKNLSPSSRRDKQDIRSYIRGLLEIPAQDIIQAYLVENKINKTTNFFFQNNNYRDTQAKTGRTQERV